MTPTAHDRPDDATLVAWLDDELAPAEHARVARAIAADPALGRRADLLRAARAELAWGLADDERAPPPSPAASPRRRGGRVALWSLAAAALAVVVTVATWRPADDASAAENDWLSVQLRSPRAGWDLFSGVRFTLEGRSKAPTPVRVVTREDGETDAQLAARAAAEAGEPVVPVVLGAEVVTRGRRMVADVAGVDGTFGADGSALGFELADLRLQYDGVGPVLAAALTPEGPREDFRWAFGKQITPGPVGGRKGFVPEEVGEYRLRLTLRAIGDAAPTWTEPLEVALGFAIRGVVGEWSAPVDGMCARVVAGTPRPGDGALAVAVQLRNDSDRARTFNVTGVTQAEVPQPFHFDLLVDGEPWRQRDDLGVIMTARSMWLPQPVDTIRSVIVLADYWRRDGAAPSSLTGEHTLAVRFHFEPSIWDGNDHALWMGKIETPPIRVTFGR